MVQLSQTISKYYPANPDEPLRNQSKEQQAYEYVHNKSRLSAHDIDRIERVCHDQIVELTQSLRKISIESNRIAKFEASIRMEPWVFKKFEELEFYHPNIFKVVLAISALLGGIAFLPISICLVIISLSVYKYRIRQLNKEITKGKSHVS